MTQDLGSHSVKYIDLKPVLHDYEGEFFDELKRYVDDGGKIMFRLRVRKKRDHPVGFVDADNSEIQYVGGTPSAWDNFPWGDGVNIDNDFSWDKIHNLEKIKEFGLSCFKCASK